jgi:hypothetical protein
MIGWMLNIIVFTGIYYGNTWRARDFPFLSQLLFSPESNGTSYVIFNQTNILNEHGHLDPAKLEVEGVPYMAVSEISELLNLVASRIEALVHVR